jgi:hypothetical protein
MKRITSTLFAAAATLLAATAAHATTTVIDFSEYAFTGQGPYGAHYFTSLTSQGFEFTNTYNSLSILANNHFATSDPGGAAMTTVFGGLTRVRRLDDKAFSLQSFDFADYYNDGTPNIKFKLTWFDGVQTNSRTLQTDLGKGLQTANLELNNVQWFTVDTQAQFDNFRMGDTVAGVPEPASWALMILGFGGAGAQLRSRRRKVVAAA